MSPSFEPPIRVDELLQHAGWLRGLAASLVRDPGRADDLVQETWLAALRRPPLAGASPRPWLERVFRNLARNRQRSERTRAEHETRASARRPSPGPDSIAQEVEAQRLLAEAVGRLSDPARTIVVLRYFRGLDASAIGRELALPAGTVRWKLKAALEDLRRELDRRFEGGRKAWSLVLARVLTAATPPLSTLSVSWLAAGAAAILVVGSAWWSLRTGALLEGEPARTGVEAAAPETPVTALARIPSDPDPAEDAEPRTNRARSPLEALVAPPVAKDDERDITGSVLVDGERPSGAIDLELIVYGSRLPGLPLPSLERLKSTGKKSKLCTDGDGSFALYASGSDTIFTLVAPGFLLEGVDSPIWVTPTHDLVLHLRTAAVIRGRVVTPDGRPVANAHGWCCLLATFDDWEVLDDPLELDCDEQGRFVVPLLGLLSDGTPASCHGTLLFEVPHVGRRVLETGPFPPADLDLGDVVLEFVRTLRFLVRDEAGAPLSGAVARLNDHWLTKPSDPTNRDGRGELRHVPERGVRVRFSALGYADRVLTVAVGDEPDVELVPACLLEVQLEPPANTYAPFPDVVLEAHDPLFEPADATLQEIFFDPTFFFHPSWPQTGLGATACAWRSSRKDASGRLVLAAFKADSGGKLLIAGILPGIPFTVEARDATGHALVRSELVLTPGERKRVALPYCD